MASSLSNRYWKVLISLLALLATALLLMELPGALTAIVGQERASLGAIIALSGEYGSSKRIIAQLALDGPLSRAGAAVGDGVTFDHLKDFYHPVAGEEVGLILHHGSERHRAVVTTEILPWAPDAAFNALGSLIVGPIFCAVGLLIGFRQPGSSAHRALSLCFIGVMLCFSDYLNLRFLPSFVPILATRSLVVAANSMVVYTASRFATLFPDDRPQGIRRVLHRYGLPPLALLCLASTIDEIANIYGFEIPPLHPLSQLQQIAMPLFLIVALSAGRAHSSGDLRTRYNWLLVSLGMATLAALPSTFDWTVAGWKVYSISNTFGLGCAILILAYAVLRHRVIDVGFALNRAAVYGVTSALLLSSFGLLEWTAEHFLHFESREQNILLDAGLALGVFLSFHRLHDFVEHWVERILFHEWHAREAALRKFVRRAAHFTDGERLLDAFVAVLGDFTGGAGYAIYLDARNGGLTARRSGLMAAPEWVSENEREVIALCDMNAPLGGDEISLIPGCALALPMMHRGVLGGFVLLGPKPQGDGYRPDEVDVLDFAVRQIGLDLRALEADALSKQVSVLSRENEAITAENQRLHDSVGKFMAGMQTGSLAADRTAVLE
ncbi:MAG TPA: hypothetical protein VKQ27_13625 [Acetobacteraceae bacterium]|nr:hypothetical protein [Acetobacteraceae bacterium]